MSPLRLASIGIERAWRAAGSWAGHWRCRAEGIELGAGARIIGMPIVQRAKGARISIGPRSIVCSSGSWTALGVAHPVVLRAMRPGASLHIGSDTGLSGGAFCAAVSVHIGDRCLIGADVMVVDTDFHAVPPQGRLHTDWSRIGCAPVVIGDDVFVGARSIVLKGVHIGAGSVIAAGSVVTRSIPAGVVAGGNPARVIRRIACTEAQVSV